MKGPGWIALLLLLAAALPYIHESWWTWTAVALALLLAVIRPIERTPHGLTMTLRGGVWIVRCSMCPRNVTTVHMATVSGMNAGADALEAHAAWHKRARMNREG